MRGKGGADLGQRPDRRPGWAAHTRSVGRGALRVTPHRRQFHWERTFMTSTDIHTGPARRYVVTGGPSAGKEAVIEAIIKAGLPCSTEEAAREIYRRHRARLGRHLQRED